MTCPRIPKEHPRIAQEFHNGGARRNVTRSTACWRRYVGTWEIRDDTFFLRSVIGNYLLSGDEPLRADWYSGTLRVPRGERIQYVHMGFGSVYAEELYIEIRRGRVIKSSLRTRSFGNPVLKSLANLPAIGKFLGEESLLAKVAFRRGNVWLLLALSILFGVGGILYLVKHVPVAATIAHWIAILTLSLIASLLLVFVYFGMAKWVRKERSPSNSPEKNGNNHGSTGGRRGTWSWRIGVLKNLSTNLNQVTQRSTYAQRGFWC